MSLELVKESIRVNQIVGEASTQAVIESDIIVPDTKPDVARILLLDGDVHVNRLETVQDKVIVEGVVRYNIIYVSDEDEASIKSINTAVNFSEELNIAGTRQDMNCKVKCDVEHVQYEILNSRKISTKAVIRLNGRVMNEIEKQIVNDLTGVNNIQILRKKFNVNCYLGRGDSVTSITEKMEVPSGKPAIREVLRTDVKIGNRQYKITENKIVAEGEINVSTLYIGDDERGSIQSMEHGIPFTQFVDLPGINEDGRVELDFDIIDASFEPEEDSDGELRLLKGEIELKICADGYCKRDVGSIEDAYSPRSKIDIEKQPFKVEELVGESRSQAILKDSLVLDDESPDISQVFNVIARPVISEYKVMDNKVVVEGVVKNNVLYLADNDENPVFSYEQEIPFRHTVDLDGITPDMSCDISLDVEHCNYSMISAREVEVRLILDVNTGAAKQISIPVIEKVVESPVDDKRFDSQPSITIYFAQPGDTLWKIGKRYYSVVDDIKRLNNLDDDAIKPGQQILIPRRNA
ncbi:MAG TPA: DUF3794 domain-containing protein [Clostridiaceae bacterium]|nr:DUF3794 domain-containing protein [Clostridiaceae bacterium]